MPLLLGFAAANSWAELARALLNETQCKEVYILRTSQDSNGGSCLTCSKSWDETLVGVCLPLLLTETLSSECHWAVGRNWNAQGDDQREGSREDEWCPLEEKATQYHHDSQKGFYSKETELKNLGMIRAVSGDVGISRLSVFILVLLIKTGFCLMTLKQSLPISGRCQCIWLSLYFKKLPPY